MLKSFLIIGNIHYSQFSVSFSYLIVFYFKSFQRKLTFTGFRKFNNLIENGRHQQFANLQRPQIRGNPQNADDVISILRNQDPFEICVAFSPRSSASATRRSRGPSRWPPFEQMYRFKTPGQVETAKKADVSQVWVRQLEGTGTGLPRVRSLGRRCGGSQYTWSCSPFPSKLTGACRGPGSRGCAGWLPGRPGEAALRRRLFRHRRGSLPFFDILAVH